MFKFCSNSFNTRIFSDDVPIESHIRGSVQWNSGSCCCCAPVPRMRDAANGRVSWTVQFGTLEQSGLKCQKTYGQYLAAYYGLDTKTILHFQLVKILETINCRHSYAFYYCCIEFRLMFLRLLQFSSSFSVTVPPLSALECYDVFLIRFSLRYGTNSNHFFLRIPSFSHWTNTHIYFLVLTI